MGSRPKRERKPTARLEEALVVEELEPRIKPKVKYVYRLLKPVEIRKSLVSRTVYVLWPEEGAGSAQWYKARVDSCKPSAKSGDLYYEETDELEQNANLAELIEQGHIAFREPRSLDHELGCDEVDVNAHGFLGRPLAERSSRKRHRLAGSTEGEDDEGYVSTSSDDDSQDAGGVDDTSDSDFEVDREEERPGPADPYSLSDDAGEEEGDIAETGAAATSPRAAKQRRRSRNSTPGGQGRKTARENNEESEEDEERAEAEAARLLRVAGAGVSTSAGSFYGAKSPKAGSAASRREADLRAESIVREKVRLGFQAAMELALKERASTSPMTRPQEEESAEQLAAEIEAALYAHHGGTNREYKARFLTLQFNLKDAGNPDLRADVAVRRLPAARLVTLSATELANKELAEYRRRKEEESLKMAVLDAEAAAKFSTAAALELKSAETVPARTATPLPPAVGHEAVVEGLTSGNDSSSFPAIPVSPRAASGRLDWAAIKASAVSAAAGHAGEDPGGDMLALEPFESWHTTAQSGQPAPDNSDLEEEKQDKGIDLTGGGKSGDNLGPQPLDVDNLQGPGDAAPAASAAASMQPDAALAHLFPLPSAPGVVLGPGPGRDVWRGPLILPGEGEVPVVLDRLTGLTSAALLLGPAPVEIRGRVALDRLEAFLADLRHSRNRTVSLGALRLASGVDDERSEALWAELLDGYRERQRTGIASLASGAEAYLLASGPLAERVLSVARAAGPSGGHPLLDPGMGAMPDDQVLVILIHRKARIEKGRGGRLCFLGIFQ